MISVQRTFGVFKIIKMAIEFSCTLKNLPIMQWTLKQKYVSVAVLFPAVFAYFPNFIFQITCN